MTSILEKQSGIPCSPPLFIEKREKEDEKRHSDRAKRPYLFLHDVILHDFFNIT